MKIKGPLQSVSASGNVGGVNFRGYRSSQIAQISRRDNPFNYARGSKWEPSQLPNKVAWFDMTSQLILRHAGGIDYIERCRNKVEGAGDLYQPLQPNQPTWEMNAPYCNGLKCARGNGTTRYIGVSAGVWDIAQPFTVFMVADEGPAVASASRVMDLGVAGSVRIGKQANPGAEFIMNAGTQKVAHAAGDGLPKRWRAIFDGANSRMYWNEVAGPVIGNIGPNHTTSMTLLALSTGGTPISMRIWEVILVSGLPTAEDITRVDIYFRKKYF